MTTLLVDVTCPRCGAVNQRREVLAEVVSGCTISPKEVIWCRECRFEIGTPDGGVPSGGDRG